MSVNHPYLTAELAREHRQELQSMATQPAPRRSFFRRTLAATGGALIALGSRIEGSAATPMVREPR
jgi:hypothetical protein